MTYDIDVECRAFSLVTQMEIIPAPFDIVLHYGPIITIQTLDRSANYFCNFICVDVGLRRTTPVAVPPRPPPTPQPIAIPVTPAPTQCAVLTSDGSMELPFIVFDNRFANPTPCFAPNLESLATIYCSTRDGSAYQAGTATLSPSSPCAGPPATTTTNFFLPYGGAQTAVFQGTPGSTLQFNSAITLTCCS